MGFFVENITVIGPHSAPRDDAISYGEEYRIF